MTAFFSVGRLLSLTGHEGRAWTRRGCLAATGPLLPRATLLRTSRWLCRWTLCYGPGYRRGGRLRVVQRVFLFVRSLSFLSVFVPGDEDEQRPESAYKCLKRLSGFAFFVSRETWEHERGLRAARQRITISIGRNVYLSRLVQCLVSCPLTSARIARRTNFSLSRFTLVLLGCLSLCIRRSVHYDSQLRIDSGCHPRAPGRDIRHCLELAKSASVCGYGKDLHLTLRGSGVRASVIEGCPKESRRCVRDRHRGFFNGQFQHQRFGPLGCLMMAYLRRFW